MAVKKAEFAAAPQAGDVLELLSHIPAAAPGSGSSGRALEEQQQL